MKNSKRKTYGIEKCRQCSKKFIKNSSVQKSCSARCAEEWAKKYNKKYNQSDKARKAREAYAQTDKGKKAVKKYYQSDKSKALRLKYKQTDKYKKYLQSAAYKKSRREYGKSNRGIEATKKYTQSDKGKAAKLRYSQSDNAKNYYREYAKSKKGKKVIRKYWNKKRETDPIFKLGHIYRNRLREFLKATNMKKTHPTFVMVGCTQKFLKKYLEKKFKPGMTWKNHTLKGWHVDHKTPLSSAKTPRALEKLMHYTNTRPMWGTENIKKGNRII